MFDKNVIRNEELGFLALSLTNLPYLGNKKPLASKNNFEEA
jgi:hypothetical protein